MRSSRARSGASGRSSGGVDVALIDEVLGVLGAQPGLTVDEVRRALQLAGHQATRREVSAVLLASRSVEQDGGAPPRWFAVGRRPLADTGARKTRSEERSVGKESVSTCRSRW